MSAPDRVREAAAAEEWWRTHREGGGTDDDLGRFVQGWVARAALAGPVAKPIDRDACAACNNVSRTHHPRCPTLAPVSPPAPQTGAGVLNRIGAVIDYFGQTYIVTSHGKSQLLGFPDALASGHVTPSAVVFRRDATDQERKMHHLKVHPDDPPPAPRGEAVEAREEYAKTFGMELARSIYESEPSGEVIEAQDRLKGTDAETFLVIKPSDLAEWVQRHVSDAFYDGEIALVPQESRSDDTEGRQAREEPAP